MTRSISPFPNLPVQPTTFLGGPPFTDVLDGRPYDCNVSKADQRALFQDLDWGIVVNLLCVSRQKPGYAYIRLRRSLHVVFTREGLEVCDKGRIGCHRLFIYVSRRLEL